MIKTIAFSKIEEVTKVLERLSKKAQKYNIDFTYTIGDSYYKKVVVREIDYINSCVDETSTFVLEVADITISENVIKSNGWTVLAHIEHMADNHNIITPINCKTIDNVWYNVSSKCNHCNTNHSRKYTYIVSNGTDTKQVGTSCLHDYTGIYTDLAMAFATVNDFITVGDNLYYGDAKALGYGSINCFAVKDIIALAVDSIADKGYKKEGGTSNLVYKMLLDHIKPTNKAVTTTDKIIDMVKNYNISDYSFISDYIKNAQAIVNSGYCKLKHFGRICYLSEIYKKYLEEIAKKEAEKMIADNSNHIGNIKDKIELNVVYTKYNSFDSMYGTIYIHQFKDSSGNVLVWKSSVSLHDIEIDSSITLKGTIKAHTEYNGVKQTELTRCKVI